MDLYIVQVKLFLLKVTSMIVSKPTLHQLVSYEHD